MTSSPALCCDWHAVVDSERRLLFTETHPDERLEHIVSLILDDRSSLAPWLDRALEAVLEAWGHDEAADRDVRLRLSPAYELRIFPLLGAHHWIGIVLNEVDRVSAQT